MPVAKALGEAGFTVWTPMEVHRRRVGRERAVKETTHAITPGIVFADDTQLHDLVTHARAPSLISRHWNPETKRMEIRGCPTFTVFRHGGKFPRIADRHLDPLRQAERRSAPPDKLVRFEEGEEVRVPSSAFGGLIGVVVRAKKKTAVVRLIATVGEMLIEVDMCDLLPPQRAA